MPTLTGKTIEQLTQITGLTSDTFFPVSYSGITYKAPYSAITNYYEVTYDELYSLYTGSSLNPGGYYLITDYRTCYDQPDYKTGGDSNQPTYKQADVEPILVRASSPTTLEVDAYQPKYPNDKIKYDVSFNLTYSENVAFGRITERIDEWNNRTDYDHRTILFKRYKTYFHQFNNPLSGTISSVSNTAIDGGWEITVVGVDTDFDNQLNVGDVIYVQGFWYKVSAIDSATDMIVTGVDVPGFSGNKYYLAQPQSEGSLSQIPYTHTQMTDPPVDKLQEASLSDFIMDGEVVSGVNYFCDNGGTSEYFTNLYPGLFVMCAKDTEISFFEIGGYLGADGGGTAEISSYSTNINGNDYTAYIKRVYDASDPSVNHIIIVNGDGTGISQSYDSNTDSDYHQISNLSDSGVNQIHYLLTSRAGGLILADLDVNALVDAYLNLVDGLDINDTLSALNADYTTLTTLVPNLYLFNDVPNNSGTISDGGDDMYDGGNFIYTDYSVIYRSYEYKNNNIIDDVYRQLTTFRSQEEVDLYGDVTSTNNWIGDYSIFYIQNNLSNNNFLLSNNVFGFNSYSNHLGERCYNNSTYSWFNRNQISGTFQNNSLRRGFYSNIIGEYFTNNIFNGYTWRNKFGEDFYDNIIGTYEFQNNVINNGFNNNYISLYDDFYKNFIANGFNHNWIWDECYGNYIGNGFNHNDIYCQIYNNTISDYFQNNELGDVNNIGSFFFGFNTINNNFNNNTCLGTFAYNDIGNYFENNNIEDGFGFGYSTSQGNKIGNYFYNNTIGEYFYNNVIADGFYFNTISDYFQLNDVKFTLNNTDFSSATHVYGNYNCTLFLNSTPSQRLSYYDGSDVLNITNITA